jgi:hypothetical protein
MTTGSRVATHPEKSWILIYHFSRPWKVLESHLGPGKYWKLARLVLESTEIQVSQIVNNAVNIV